MITRCEIFVTTIDLQEFISGAAGATIALVSLVGSTHSSAGHSLLASRTLARWAASRSWAVSLPCKRKAWSLGTGALCPPSSRHQTVSRSRRGRRSYRRRDRREVNHRTWPGLKRGATHYWQRVRRHVGLSSPERPQRAPWQRGRTSAACSARTV